MLVCPHCGEAMEELDINFDYYSGLVSCGSKSVRFTELQLVMLECLMDAYPNSVPEQELYDSVYEGRDAEDLPTPQALNVNMNRMKNKLTTAEFPVRIWRVRKEGSTMDFVLANPGDRKQKSEAA